MRVCQERWPLIHGTDGDRTAHYPMLLFCCGLAWGRSIEFLAKVEFMCVPVH